MDEALEEGLKHELRFKIPDSKTVPQLYPESDIIRQMPAVFATGFLVGLVEWACIDAVTTYLDYPDELTVGTHIDISHESPTPPGLEVTAQVELKEIDGNRLYFETETRDTTNTISRGTHERAVVNRESFTKHANSKSQRTGTKE